MTIKTKTATTVMVTVMTVMTMITTMMIMMIMPMIMIRSMTILLLAQSAVAMKNSAVQACPKETFANIREVEAKKGLKSCDVMKQVAITNSDNRLIIGDQYGCQLKSSGVEVDIILFSANDLRSCPSLRNSGRLVLYQPDEPNILLHR
ncbi:MAG: hypothetical protein C5B49_16215 [Bdellovibrio sp.]|nr:MAG: hypothetical protein C5B49_16215 [Bdellovibrio sp.]